MSEGQKRAVSLRLSPADLRRIKQMSERLGVRDAQLIRYAIKGLLSRLSPLTDPAQKGRALVPLFLEGGAELVRQFELDADQLDAIINGGAEPAQRVSPEDLHLIAMAAVRLPPATSQPLPPPAATADIDMSGTRRYLYDKYVFSLDAPQGAAASEN